MSFACLFNWRDFAWNCQVRVISLTVQASNNTRALDQFLIESIKETVYLAMDKRLQIIIEDRQLLAYISLGVCRKNDHE